MSGLIFGIVQIFWLLYALITFAAVSRAVKAETRDHKKWQVGLTVLFYFAIVPVGLGGYNWYIEWDARKRNEAVNERFTKRCKEDARVTIKRVVENVDGVFIIKPRGKVPGDSGSQFWMGDPYGSSSEDHEFGGFTLLFARNATVDQTGTEAQMLKGYRFIEMPNPDLEKNANAPPYLRVSWDGEKDPKGFRVFIKTPVSERLSKYGYDWDDISAPEDRKYWIAGGRMRILDLQTEEVIAERIGFLVDRMQGGRVGGGTWGAAWEASCPVLRRWGQTKTQDFLELVLKSSKESENGK